MIKPHPVPLVIMLALHLLFTAACASTSASGIVAQSCGATTDVRVEDLESLGIRVSKSKVLVMRLFTTWCPYCKEDLEHIGRRFQNGTWTKEKIALVLVAYRNPREDRERIEVFKNERLATFGIPQESTQVIYIDKPYPELLAATNTKGHALFTGWKGVPFGLVFGKDGRLAFRGHFTSSLGFQENHYRFITELQDERCGEVP
ncbi:MAG: hypothetical protein AB7G93_05670 [Bdellovibrionales bacterium]